MLNKLMLSTSIALMSTAALATAQAQEAEMHTEMTTGAEAEMASHKVKASNVVGADLEYADGASAITDIRMTDAGDPEALVISRGGFLGLFDEEVAVSTVAASISHDEDGELVVTASLTDEQLEDAEAIQDSPFVVSIEDQREDGELFYSDLTGAAIMNDAGETIAHLEDVKFTLEGDTEYAIIRDGGFLGLGGEVGVVDFDELDLAYSAESGWTVTSDMTAEDVRVMEDTPVNTGAYLDGR
ncbi:PRC-barrel domain-containing protein [Oceanicaulis sp. MMSF_3324]|uniref:PRC-barrel domain-containing protein n=1 Tax=Oceanicaulis sp. MMSF_3324 TaxID=3046702 RepID=UPI00273FA920|nr:PRC-barrel domain-containing protein [Oceanicaulis sp. MMSF_3324]